MKQATKSPTSQSGAAGKTPVALGFRAHSGWAALVAVAGSPRPARPPIEPLVIDRRRIELARAGVPVQPYHAAAELELRQAAELIARCAQEACELAREALLGRVAQLRQKGYDVVGCGVLLSSGGSASTLESTLASHALIHTAEGELFRNAIVQASESCSLPVTRVKERELHARAAMEFGLRPDELPRRLNELGRTLGPPWRQDQKYAALVAWLALGAAAREAYA
jgi:hypothetical protein